MGIVWARLGHDRNISLHLGTVKSRYLYVIRERHDSHFSYQELALFKVCLILRKKSVR